MREAKPILGFGPIGWVAAAIFAALVVAVLSGWDLQLAVLRAINDALGIDALYWFVLYWLSFHSTTLLEPYFNTLTILYAIVALRIVPMRISWWRYALVIFWGLSRPVPFWYLMVNRWISGGGWNSLHHEITHTALSALTCLVFWAVTRSRVVLLVSVGWFVANASYDWLMEATFVPGIGSAWSMPLFEYFRGILWHLSMAGVLLWWAISERRKPREGHCQSCGYDLRGASHERCPECGALTAQPLPAPSP